MLVCWFPLGLSTYPLILTFKRNVKSLTLVRAENKFDVQHRFLFRLIQFLSTYFLHLYFSFQLFSYQSTSSFCVGCVNRKDDAAQKLFLFARFHATRVFKETWGGACQPACKFSNSQHERQWRGRPAGKRLSRLLWRFKFWTKGRHPTQLRALISHMLCGDVARYPYSPYIYKLLFLTFIQFS